MIGCQEYGVQLRVENISDFNFDKISVNNVPFGPLEKQQITKYLPFENIYEAEFVEVQIGDRTLKVIPEEFDETKFYNTGNYKYVIDVVHEKWLSIKFVNE